MTRIILLCLLLSGCATATRINTGAGPAEYFVECDGAAVPWSKCYARANELCPRGYDNLERSADNGPLILGVQQKNMRIRCR